MALLVLSGRLSCYGVILIGLQSEQALHIMAGIPEYSIKDMVNWFRFIAANQPRLLSGLEASLHVYCNGKWILYLLYEFSCFMNALHGFINIFHGFISNIVLMKLVV